jgi:hypothetical protein
MRIKSCINMKVWEKIEDQQKDEQKPHKQDNVKK